MKATAITYFLALFIAAVVAQTTAPFYLTNPIVGTTYKAGSTVTITWTNGVDDSAQVSLLTGTNAATMTPTGDSFTIKGSDGEYEWKVPSELPQNATFAFKIDYTDSNGAAGSTYSSGFAITGTTGDVVSQSFVSSIATAVSTAPATALSTAVSTASASRSSAVPSSSVLIRSSVMSTSASASATASASTTPQVPSVASGSKAPTVAICAIVLVATALFF
ncbi:hypothetical protein [Parasitella parasitica]|uniref:Yeast cell wall synthesis Kre9/Knh1-like N-terminal domain-containing protein n=1 Tax=Parasitella parasitica TaxID=35722 RepID=A0A0B7NMG2_9FUNG|nr:hypothetical protein [Parasitella parasitica]